MSVLLLNMPFAQLRWPNLGLSLLKSSLTVRGIDCDLKNLCFPFAERVGYDLYDWIAGHFAFVLGGEHLFAKIYFGNQLPSTEQFWHDILLWTEPELDEQDKADFETVAAAVLPFLDDCMESIDWKRYKIVGFTTSYQQTLSSLCLARRIKEQYPHIQIVLGGAACEGEMGNELLRQFKEIDYVFLGEADMTFPFVVQKILDGNIDSQSLPKGVLSATTHRQHEQEKRFLSQNETINAFTFDVNADVIESTVTDLDRIPPPDFDDYFNDWRSNPLRNEVRPMLFFETSRGCWWGERRQCSFCGLNGHSLRFRCKTPKHAVTELVELVKRYKIREACFADNIFAKEYFETFLPLLKESGLDLRFEFEMKANQKKEHVRKMLDAGLAAAQLGIETLSTPILKMLSKGATARHNLQVLKWYTEGGIEVKWNILYGFPSEDPKEYEKLTQLLPLVFHFHPPVAFGKVRIDRFAPYHNDPKKYGIENLRPFRGFHFLYPFDDQSLRHLSYYHEFDFADGRDIFDYVKPFLEQVKRWDEEYAKGTLRAFDRNDGVLLLTDTRPIAKEFQYRLSGIDRELYLFCDVARTRQEILERFPDSVEKTLTHWIEQRIMIPVDNRFFALALNEPPSISS
ncbi:MAG: RiPP maturation radical SAM C-methyltransferase [Planctomycetaceae bacterium]|jgi:ribosomal peptide maturation radical SAM protein 1|nr:RiPP maturation radical SAM C-methyltransferase [Planctomycetaceae bacterium]